MTTAERPTEKPVGLDAKTMCEAFQKTADAHPDRPALRTRGDEVSFTWGEVRRAGARAGGGARLLGVGKGDTIALMLSNRPEFHLADAAGMHLGATCFRSTTPTRPSRSSSWSATRRTAWRSRSRRLQSDCSP